MIIPIGEILRLVQFIDVETESCDKVQFPVCMTLKQVTVT